MRRAIPIFILLLLDASFVSAKEPSLLSSSDRGGRPRAVREQGLLSVPDFRAGEVAKLGRRQRLRQEEASAIARRQGWAPRESVGGRVFELMGIEGDRVYVYATCNSNAAISIAADQIRNTSPYNLSGAGLTIGIWDGGSVRTTHQEFGLRVTVMDGASAIDHATHVGGTMAAGGFVLSAMGMAPSVSLDSYNWNLDEAEMAARGMSYANEPGTLQISNHSYAIVCGWEDSYSPPRWVGAWSTWVRESDLFGQYDDDTAVWDQICYDAPYYLPFKAVGNDRTDTAPAEGVTFQYFYRNQWREAAYDPSIHPYGDNWDNGGYDTIGPLGTAKNVLTVGAVTDAVTGGVRDFSKAYMTSYSCWGPTDDGRIKPDVVTNGYTVYSSYASSDSSYTTLSGTSVASPGAAGAAALLMEYYGDLLEGQVMRASTLKGLLIHTADDLGTAGPDYKFGWGLLNVKAAADQIGDHAAYPEVGKITEAVLNGGNPSDSYVFKWDGISSIRATLCWTDPAGSALEELDNPSPRLINDLDLRIIDPNGGIWMPFVLNPASPTTAASAGDNVRDNTEQVLIAAPSLAGYYTVQVSHKGTLTNGQQYYSLILSGQALPVVLAGDFTDDGVVDCNDLSVLAGYWLGNEPSADLDPSDPNVIINYKDFSVFSQEWLRHEE
jgi:hypothetical protein